MVRKIVTTGSKWEDFIGYSRAVKIGNTIEISGTVAADNSGEVVGLDDSYLQTKFIFLKVQNVLEQLGATMADVVRTRIFTTDISQWEAIGKAHGEFFADIKPVTTMVEVSKLIDPKYMIEIEVSAVIIA
jgi:enamine deaminase RidA (YjgF/YER057c/UK114 family)